MTPAVIITLALVAAHVALAFAYARRIEREHIPTEDSVVLDINPLRGMSLAAAINLSRAVRRIH
jgi:hypothetical protein